MNKDLQPIIDTIVKAGSAILQVKENLTTSHGKVSFERKKDHSSVTQADLAAHHIIVDFFKTYTPDLPVVSEESDLEKIVPTTLQTYWLIDPLDGTEGFIRGLDEYTVNIALIENHRATLGLVYHPPQKKLYYAQKNVGAFSRDLQKSNLRESQKGQDTRLKLTSCENLDSLRLILSSLHRTTELETAKKVLPGALFDCVCSSLKYCFIAEAKADLSFRFRANSAWDTAASQIILEEAGGQMLDSHGNTLCYGIKENWDNPKFMALTAMTRPLTEELLRRLFK